MLEVHRPNIHCSQIRSIHKELGKVEHFLVVPYFLFNARFPHNPFHFNSSIPFFLRFCYPHRMFFSLTPGSCIVVLVYRLLFFAANSVSPTNFHNCLLVFFQFKTTSLSSASPFIRTRIEIWLVQNACKVWRNQSKLRHFDPANSLFDWRWISQTI